MVKIQTNSQGKAYLTTGGKALAAPEGGSSEFARFILQNRTAVRRNIMPDFSIITAVGEYALYMAYEDLIFEENTHIDMSNILTIASNGAKRCFSYGNAVSADLSSVESVGQDGLYEAFYNNHSLVSLDLSSLQTVGFRGLGNVCNGCNHLSSVNLQNLTTVGRYGLDYALQESAITSIIFNQLSYIDYCGFEGTFAYSSIQEIRFPALTSHSFADEDAEYTFTELLDGCSNVTVHFPSNLQSVIGNWSDVINGFSGTNTTILFDLPATE